MHTIKYSADDLVYTADDKAIHTFAEVFESVYEPGMLFGVESNRDEHDYDYVFAKCEDITKTYEKATEEWISDYVSSEDYGGEYIYLIKESHYANEQLKECWGNVLADYYPIDHFKNNANWCDVNECIFDGVLEKCIDQAEMEYNDNEYSSNTFAIPLDSFGVGEYEHQEDADNFWQYVKTYCKENDIDYEMIEDNYLILAEAMEKIIYRFDANDINPFNVGEYNGKQYIKGQFYIFGGGGSWHYGINDETFAHIVTECKIEYCRNKDEMSWESLHSLKLWTDCALLLWENDKRFIDEASIDKMINRLYSLPQIRFFSLHDYPCINDRANNDYGQLYLRLKNITDRKFAEAYNRLGIDQ